MSLPLHPTKEPLITTYPLQPSPGSGRNEARADMTALRSNDLVRLFYPTGFRMSFPMTSVHVLVLKFPSTGHIGSQRLLDLLSFFTSIKTSDVTAL